MVFLRVIVFLLAMFSGTIFSMFIFTAIEARSPGFQKFSLKIHQALPKAVWNIILIIAAVGFGFLSYRMIADFARAGIVAGLLTGIVFFFRSGPNINYKDMEKAASEFDKEQQAKRAKRIHRGKQTSSNYKGAKKTPKRLK